MDLRLNLLICIGVASLVRVLIIPSASAKESQWSFENDGGQASFRPALTLFSPKPHGFLNISNIGLSEGEQLTFQASDLIQITGIQLEPTTTGLNVVLETAAEPLTLLTLATADDSLVIDIPNAVLTLPDEQAFQADSPAEGVASVTVAQLTANQVRVSIVGSE